MRKQSPGQISRNSDFKIFPIFCPESCTGCNFMPEQRFGEVVAQNKEQISRNSKFKIIPKKIPESCTGGAFMPEQRFGEVVAQNKEQISRKQRTEIEKLKNQKNIKEITI